MGRMDHQLRFLSPVHAGASPATHLARLDLSAGAPRFEQARNAGAERVRAWQTRLASAPLWFPLTLAMLIVAGLCARSRTLRERVLLAWKLRARDGALPPHTAALFYRRMLLLLERARLAQIAGANAPGVRRFAFRRRSRGARGPAHRALPSFALRRPRRRRQNLRRAACQPRSRAARPFHGALHGALEPAGDKFQWQFLRATLARICFAKFREEWSWARRGSFQDASRA